MENMNNISIVITVVGILTVMTNIIVEVLKKLTFNVIPTQFLAAIVSEVLTILIYVGYCNYCDLKVTWYFVTAAIVLGFMVSYAAMFGFDTLKKIINEEVRNKWFL